MLIGKEKVLEYMNLTKAREFIIYQGTSKTPIYYYKGNGGEEMAKNFFLQWAGIQTDVSPVEYRMTIYPKGAPKAATEFEEGVSPKDTINVSFYLVSPNPWAIPAMNGTPGTLQNPGQYTYAGMPGENQADMAARIRMEMEREYELADLEDEVEELRAGQTELTRTLQQLMGYAAPLLQGLFGISIPGMGAPAPAAPGGIPRSASLAGMPEQAEAPVQQRTVSIQDLQTRQQIINRLAANDPEIWKRLGKLADLQEQKPDTYKFLASQLDTLI